MVYSRYYRWLAATTLALALAPCAATAHEENSLSISGTFAMDSLSGTVGADLAGVFDRGGAHTWVLTLQGVSYVQEYVYLEWGDPQIDGGYLERYITRAHATSFTLEFFGLDGATLTSVVSGQLTGGGLTNGAVIELENGDYWDWQLLEDSGPYSTIWIGLVPLDFENGVAFSCWAYELAPFFTPVYPAFEPGRYTGVHAWIEDERFPNSGEIHSFEQVVDIGSSDPPVLPPTLSIADGSIAEGNTGTSQLALTVSLSRSSTDAVTVNYATANGTALAKADYTATKGTFTLQPGERSRTISIAIKGDRKRESNETFSIQLSSAVGATIADGIATATIVNDD